jgi:hypothetical protein
VKLGELLLQDKIITQEQLQKALDYQKENPKVRIGEALVKLGFVSIKTIVEIQAKQVLSDAPPLPRLGEILLTEGAITQEQLRKALEHQERHPGTKLGQTLIDLGFATKEAVSKALGKMGRISSAPPE